MGELQSYGQKDRHYEVEYRSVQSRGSYSDTSYRSFIYSYPITALILFKNGKIHGRSILNIETESYTHFLYASEVDKVYYTTNKQDPNIENIFVVDSVKRYTDPVERNGMVCDSLKYYSKQDTYALCYNTNYEFIYGHAYDTLTNHSLVIHSKNKWSPENTFTTDAIAIHNDIIHPEWLSLDTSQYFKRDYDLELSQLLLNSMRRDDEVFDDSFSHGEIYDNAIWGEPLQKQGNGANFELVEKVFEKGLIREDKYIEIRNKDVDTDIVSFLKNVPDTDSISSLLQFLAKEHLISEIDRTILDTFQYDFLYGYDKMYTYIFHDILLKDSGLRKIFVENLERNKITFTNRKIKYDFILGNAGLADLLSAIEHTLKLELREEYHGLTELTAYIDNSLKKLIGPGLALEYSLIPGPRPTLKIYDEEVLIILDLSELFAIDGPEPTTDNKNLERFLSKATFQHKSHSNFRDASAFFKVLPSIAEQISTDHGMQFAFSLANWRDLLNYSEVDQYFIYKYSQEGHTFSATPFAFEFDPESRSSFYFEGIKLEPPSSEPWKLNFSLIQSSRKKEFLAYVKEHRSLFQNLDIESFEQGLFTRQYRSESYLVDGIPSIAFKLPYRDWRLRTDLSSGTKSFEECFLHLHEKIGHFFTADSVKYQTDNGRFLTMKNGNQTIEIKINSDYNRSLLQGLNAVIPADRGAFYRSIDHVESEYNTYYLTPEVHALLVTFFKGDLFKKIEK